MRHLKIYFLYFFLIFFCLISAHKVIASTGYTMAGIANHNSTNSCWVVYNGGVYDITTYLPIHNRQSQNITSWCGQDITTTFQSIGNHQGRASSLLETFKIGIVIPTTTDTIVTNNNSSTQTASSTLSPSNTTVVKNPYNLLLPLILATLLYWGSRVIVFNTKIHKPMWMNIRNFNGFWNTILIITLLIPSLGFGIFMILRYQFHSLFSINFNFIYWHVELSVFMGILAVSHFIQRFKTYLIEIKRK